MAKASLHCNGISILSWPSDFECTIYSLGNATLVIFSNNEDKENEEDEDNEDEENESEEQN